MRSLAGRVRLAVVAAFLAASAAGAADSVKLAFKIKEGERSSYSLDLELDVATTAEQGTQKQQSSARTTIGLAMDVVEHEAKEGERPAPELAVTFRDLTVDQELSGASGEISVEIRGSDVVAKRGGATIVDTKVKKGADLAKGLLGEFAFLGQEGRLSVEPSGRVTAISGPETFKSFFAPDSGAGLWVLETKRDPVAPGESWKSAGRRVTKLRGLDLSTNPLTVEATYTLEEVSERDGRKVAKIRVASDLVRERALTATVSGEALRDTRVDIRRLERKAEGTVLLDVEAGRLLESDVNVTLAVEMELTVRNERTKKDELVKTSVKGSGRSRIRLREAESGAEPATADDGPPKADEEPPKAE